jgi:dihydroxyacetone kinase-like predicted kinase
VLDALDAGALLRWRDQSIEALAAARAEIDALNIFPVPDADTGTNLHLTLSSPLGIDGAAQTLTAAEAATLIAEAALYGARGSSGVILSQLLRGFAVMLAAGAAPCRGRLLAHCLDHAANAAYAAVSRPVEGTMLTVARVAASAALEANSDELGIVAGVAAKAAQAAAAATPDQLPVLASAGVSDAGARGLALLLEVLAAVVDETLPPSFATGKVRRRLPTVTRPETPGSLMLEVMFLVRSDDAGVAELRRRLDVLGVDVVVSGGAGLWNVHVHTADADSAVLAGRAAGSVERIAVRPLLAHRPAVPVIAATDDAITAALAAFVSDGGGTLLPAANLELLVANLEAMPTSETVIAVGHDVAVTVRHSFPDIEVIEVTSVLQALAVLAVFAPGQPGNGQEMAETAKAARHAQALPAMASTELHRLISPTTELVTLAAASRAIADEVVAGMTASAALRVEILIAPDLGDIVLIGVE